MMQIALNNPNKVIYLASTYKCSACKLQKYLLEDALVDREDIKLEVCDYTELPEWIKANVKLTDFPTTIFIKDDVIKYHFVGTRPVKKFKQLLEDIDF